MGANYIPERAARNKNLRVPPKKALYRPERPRTPPTPARTPTNGPIRPPTVRIRLPHASICHRRAPYGFGASRTDSEYTFTYMVRPVRTRRARYGVGTLGYGLGAARTGSERENTEAA